MYKRNLKNNYNKIQKFSIRKYSFGAASVAIASYLLFMGNGAVAANEVAIQEKSTSVTKVNVDEISTKKEEKQSDEKKNSENENKQLTNVKGKLQNYIQEIESKLAQGVYSNKTEESIQLVRESLSLANNAKSSNTISEVESAYAQLITTVNAKLRNKAVEKKETPVKDTTEGKETVGIKAENTEKKSESNAIENTGANDPRNGSEIQKDTTFRAAVNQDPKVEFNFSIPNEKKIYIYNEEHFSLEIPVYSETGKIRYATIKKGSRQRFPNVAGTDNDLDVEFGFTARVINRAETAGVTSDASQANPAKIVITGRPNDVLKKHRDYTKQETQTLNIGTRYVQVVDDQGRENLKKGDSIADPGYFYLVLKAQSKKYALRSQPTDEKISVTSLTNPTAEDLKKIKDSIQLEYSTTNEDARFADKRGTLVEHPEDVIQSVNIVGNNIVVTFTDGSTKTKPVGEIVQKNTPPTVTVPYSDTANKNVYIYSGEETDLTFTATDESKLKDLKLRGPGDINYNNATSYGLAVGKVTDSALSSGEGSVSDDKKTATIKMTGTTNLKDGQKWTSIIVAKDDNNGESAPFDGRINATTNPAERQKIEGYVEFVVKNQTSKYDIKSPEGTVSVLDPTNVTAEEFEKIKEKVKIEYSQTNNDANFTSKSGQLVDNQATRISTITKDSNGNLVVTYKDGSTDTKPLSEFTSLNKQPAIDAVNKAAEDKIAEINANTNATAEEKEAAIQKVNADKTKTLTAINNNSVTTKTALDNAKTSGTTAISNDNPVVTKKDTAKAAIDIALREKEAAIDANNALTTEEKNAAKADAQAKATAAKAAIDNATTNSAVDSAKTAGTTSVSSVTPTATAKPTAKNAIDEALKAKEAQLDGRADLTDEEKKAAKADAQARATAAKAAIDNATTNATVDSAKTSGVADVESVNPQASQKKTDAKNAVDDALKAKEAAIDANNDLTDEEKAKAKESAKAKADAAKQAIDNATTNAAVEKAKTDGATSVNSVNPTAQAKPAAKKAIDDALKAKNDAIDARTDLTDEEKTAAKADAKAKADAAKQAIDNATTNDAVTQAKNDGATSVDAVNPTPVAKPAAKKAIDDALKAKDDEIDANNDLTAEEKAKAKEDAKAKADAAKTAIDTARTNDAVTQAKTDGATSVDSVNPTAEAKPAAKKAIDDALKAKNDAIDANNDLTAEEKAKAKEDAKAKADAAKQAIDNATTNDAVTQAKTDGATSVDAVNPTPVAKPAAKKAIDDALKAKNDAIDANNDLTAEEKAKAKEDAKVKADAAKQAIDNATTNAGVEQAKANGTTEVNNVNPTPVVKPAAKKAVEDALKAKEAEIDARDDLTAEEKIAAKEEAKAKADAAKQAVDKATTNADVENAKTTGVADVNSLNPVAVKKPESKKAVDEALKAKEAEIDANNDLTAEEKLAAKEEAKAKADAAKQAIDEADTDIKVDVNSVSGLSDVNSFSPEPVKKSEAKKAIDAALEKKIEEIDARDDLTTEEKTVTKAEAENKANQAKEAIDAADTDIKVDVNSVSGLSDVNSFSPEAAKKPAAKQAIDDALKAKEDAIDANDDLTAEEKVKAKAEAKAKADAAKEAIDNATTNAEVEQAKTAGATKVDSVNPLAVKKPEAKKAIDEALKIKNDEIDARTDLTDEEKSAAKAEAKKKADAAKEAIDNATTNAEVDQAKANGTTEVKAVNPQPVAKTEAKKAIDDVLKAKNDEIDARTDLTDEEKTAAKANAKAIADGAKEAIDKATTNAEVEQAKTNGTSEVTSVNPEPVAKTEAKKAIDEALKAKNGEIDGRTDLTEEEKIAAKADVKAKADAAKTVIDKATTNVEVDQAKANGKTEVNNVNPEAVVKTEAKKAIDVALKAKNDEIDARTDLTDEEKTAAKAYAQAKANAAKEEIDKATTNAEVNQAKTNGTLEVTSVNPQPVAKPEAKKAIDEVLKAKNDEIDARTDLTDEEKVKAKEEAKVKADAAKKAIDRATTDEEVEQTEINGTTEVKAVDPQPVAKTEAKKAIDEVLKAKTNEIDARTDLTDEEKTAAKVEAKAKADAAKEGIDIATTNAEIDQVKKNGTTEVASVNPEAVAKTEAKEAIEDALKAKNDEIDARTDLTDEEKTAAKAEAKAKADAAKEAIDKATTNAEVGQAKTTGVTEVASVNPEALVKSAAKKAIEDKLAEQLKVIANTPDATDEEKKAAADLAKQLAEVAKKAIDAARENAEVKKLQDDSKVGIEEAVPFVEDKPNARKAIDEEAKVKKAAIDARTDISDKVKELLKAEVDEIAEQAKKAIDAASSVNELNKIVEAKKSEIKAVEEVRVPAEKVIVADPTKLTNEEKAKVLAAIKSVNPDAKEITQDEKGNVVVVTANGHKQVISVAQVTKTEADLVKENAGNVVNTPVAKTAVTDVTKLTEAEKQEIIAKVKVVNPGVTVAIDEKGNVIVTNGEGLVFVLPVLDLVIPTDKLTDITANSKVNTPAIRTLVANKGSLTPEEIAKIKASIEEINPGAIVVVDSKGNATVTTRDGKSMTISSDVLVKDVADVAVKNNGENINLDFDKELVADINNLTESDKEKVKFKVLGAIREAVELVVDEKGNATVILKDGRTFTILAKDIFEQRKEITVNLPEKVKVKDASNLTEAEKEAVKQALITANPKLKDAKITVSNTGEATIVYPDGQMVVISAKNLVVAEKVTATIIEGNSGTYTREDKKPMVDSSNDNTPKFNAKQGQRLANTGEAETNIGLAGVGMALLGGLLAAAKRRKEREE